MNVVARGSSSSPFQKVNAKPSAELCGEFPVDLHRMRVVFPGRWQSFLKAHFRDLQHVQFFFGVSERTAREWLHGVGSPRVEPVLYAVAAIPGALAELMEAA